jgi:predicted XRE-type DNA-binding protein
LGCKDRHGLSQKTLISPEREKVEKRIVIRGYLMEEIVALLIQCQMSKTKVQIKLKIQMFK